MKDNMINRNNPIKSKDKDWFDELCKKYNTENHWKKEKPKKKKSK
jgi:hypothetical protein